jgi:hypothetical protein
MTPDPAREFVARNHRAVMITGTAVPLRALPGLARLAGDQAATMTAAA